MKGRLLDAIPLSRLSGISKNQIRKLAKIGLHTVQDILLHLPLRYEDRTKLYPISSLLPGIWATVRGKVLHTEVAFLRHRILISQISDGTGVITLRFFNFNAGIKKRLSPGVCVIAYGEVKRGKRGIEIIHPEYRIQRKKQNSTVKLQETLTPIYPTTIGIRQTTLRNLTDQALKLLDIFPLDELLPVEIRGSLFRITDALHTLHRPPQDMQLNDLKNRRNPALYRLILEELIAHNLSMLAVRESIQHCYAFPIPPDYQLSEKLLSSLPFKPTTAQRRVIKEIEQDLTRSRPMMRLVQGDVGSGKTLVAALAALYVISCGKQVVLMTPTELLAEQHVNSFRKWFSPLGLEVGWLVGKQKGKARQVQQQAIANGQVSMIIGTHAIFQEQVQFNCLALAIIDEQHRFGVHQRISLWKKGENRGFYPHQLVMTATPIPRTLAMITYANLDTSVIDEVPPGRTSITTVAIPDSRREEIIERIKYACQIEGRQAYWVCTLIEESDLLRAQAAKVTWEELKIALPNLRIGLVHSRIKSQEKQNIMQAFKQNKIHLLVATTVIEVGIDVPNASLMIIENPERLGLAQLHQLRGRVGRGSVASHCVLLYKSPLSKIARKRLQILRDSNDGFIIAQCDLEIRGPGEFFGKKQTGNSVFRFADFILDQALIPEVQRIALHIHHCYPKKARALIERWLPEIDCYINI